MGMSVAVCIATSGRPKVLSEIVRHVHAQSHPPDVVILSPSSESDIARSDIEGISQNIKVLSHAGGLTAKRNILLEAANTDIVLFLDDDFLIDFDYVKEMIALFSDRQDAILVTGHVLADGAQTLGISVSEAIGIIGNHKIAKSMVGPVYNAYGCNMALRWSVLRKHACFFDEELPLYGWAEDVDFSRRASHYGTVLKSNRFFGVHLGVKSGKVSGLRFGYSQIANQYYLVRKGSITASGALRKTLANIVANCIGAIFHSSPVIDRNGRLLGNARGLMDLVIGRCKPSRILDL